MALIQTDAIILTTEQQTAHDKIIDFVQDPLLNEFKLGGFAGTGKTTLLKFLRASLRELTYTVAFGAFTGKACSVLIKKGIPAQTLHSLIYDCQTDPKTHEMLYILRSQLPNDIDVLVVDEASMISTELYTELKTFNIKILFVGDPGQLEPVGSNPNLMKHPDFVLTKIHRQAELSPIISLATTIRAGGLFPRKCVGDELMVRDKRLDTATLLSVDQVICAKNKTRSLLNSQCRKALGHSERLAVNEKLICLRNNKKLGLFNGLIVFIDRILREESDCFVCSGHTETGDKLFDLRVWSLPFYEEVDSKNPRIPRDCGYFDYAYAITCHKSQGSEWDSVLVVDEWVPPAIWDMSRWRYTAITRAAKKLIYCL